MIDKFLIVIFLFSSVASVTEGRQVPQFTSHEELVSIPPGFSISSAYARFLGEQRSGAIIYGHPSSSANKADPYFYYVSEDQGSWSYVSPSEVPERLFRAHVVDFDRDGYDDLIVRSPYNLVFRRGEGMDGMLGFSDPQIILQTSARIEFSVFADINNDGFDDVVYLMDAINPGTGFREEALYTSLNNGDGFLVPNNRPIVTGVNQILWIGDVDGDGRTDIIVGSSSLGSPGIGFMKGASSGHFLPPNLLSWQRLGSRPEDITVYDFDGDGDLELSALMIENYINYDRNTEQYDTVRVRQVDLWQLHGVAPAELESSWLLDPRIIRDDSDTHSLYPGDFSGSGKTELLITRREEGLSVRNYYAITSDSLELIQRDSTTLTGSMPFITTESGKRRRLNSWQVIPRPYYASHFVSEQLVNESTLPQPSAPTGLSIDVFGNAVALSASPILPSEQYQTVVYQLQLRRIDESFSYSSESHSQFESTWDYSAGGKAQPFWYFESLAQGSYEASIFAINASGVYGPRTESVGFQIVDVELPSTPVNLIASDTEGFLQLTFSLDAPFDSLHVYRSSSTDLVDELLHSTLFPGTFLFKDFDLTAGETYSYRMRAFRNGYASDFSEMTTAQASEFQVSAVVLDANDFSLEQSLPVDFDSDGYDDVLTLLRSNSSQNYVVQWIPGSRAGLDPSQAETLFSQSDYIGKVLAGDIDGDQDNDLVISGEQVHIVRFDGLNRVDVQTIDVGREENGVWLGVISVADLDLDGRQDLIIGGQSRLRIGWSLDPAIVQIQDVTFSAFNSYTARVIDFDQDGFRDLIVNDDVSRTPTLYKNLGTRAFEKMDLGLPPVDEVGQYLLFDPIWLNDDIYPDLLLVNARPVLDSLDIYHTVPAHSFVVYDDIATAYSAFSMPLYEGSKLSSWNGYLTPAHLNNDGYMDFLTFTDNQVYFWWNDSNEALRAEIFDRSTGGAWSALFSIDDDDDGDLETFFTLGDDPVFYRIPNAGLSNEPPQIPQNLTVYVNSDGADFTWENSSDDTSLPGHISYKLQIAFENEVIQIDGIHRNQILLNNLPGQEFVAAVAALDPMGASSEFSSQALVTGTGDEESPADVLELYPVFPNPFRGEGTIQYNIPERSEMRIVLYDILGRKVALLEERMSGPGKFSFQVAIPGLAPGLYFYRLETSLGSRVQKLTVL
ncbi:MAG: hypothetical protein BMS9Abin05_2469 [Rhodothermia bacterium]|nr:MAG: hypothetical protein BMS9Abin05_2469 [Rhodothermia bacterium]